MKITKKQTIKDKRAKIAATTTISIGDNIMGDKSEDSISNSEINSGIDSGINSGIDVSDKVSPAPGMTSITHNITKHRYLSPDDIYDALTQLVRSPFRDVLTQLLSCAPTSDSIRDFADKHPDRWAQAIAIFGRLAGYNEHLTVTADITAIHRVSSMSDSDLEAAIKALGASPIIDVKPVSSDGSTR